VQRRIGRVPLRPITNQFTKEATINEVVSIFDEYAGHVADTAPFRTMISELCENVLAHSEITSPGYVCARVLENAMKVEIAIADTGVGIRQSFMTGTNATAVERIKKGASALEIAVEGLNSSKPLPPSGSFRSYYGFGLLVTRRLVEENRGQMFILSGEESLRLDRYQRSLKPVGNPWNGTFVAVVLDLTYPLPLARIYEETAEQKIGTQSHATASQVHVPPPPPTAAVPATIIPSGTVAVAKPSEQVKEPLSSSPIRIELRHYGTELLTRDAGTAIRADLAGYLAAGYQVEVHLEGLSDITPSVADEAFAKLAEIMGHPLFDERVTFVGGSQLAQRLIGFVLKTRRAKSS